MSSLMYLQSEFLVVKHGHLYPMLIFVGYYEDVKAYRLFDPYSREVLFRWDVQFDESLPAVDTLPLESTSLTTTLSSSLVSFLDDDDDDLGDPHLPPP